MQSMFRYLPRKYRAVIARVLILAIGLLILCFMLSSDQSTTGTGRSDESLFQFDYDQDITEGGVQDYLGDESIAMKPIAPVQMRDVDLDIEEPGGNFTEDALLNPDEVEYYTQEELEPRFKRSLPNPADPGEYGKPFRITTNDKDIQAQIKAGWDKHAFNHYVCEKISLHRFIGDKRDKECKERKWKKPLPTTSVIIIFHNEAWCALLRTVHSVLESSPKVALKEIILVDDASTFDDLKEKLDEYVKSLEIVRVLHLPERAGLIRARLAGAEAAEGDVLTFLDSHCECAPFWLEPLLERIAEDPTRVVCPVIEVIDADTFAMSITTARSVQRGIMGWSLNFNWGPQKRQPGTKLISDAAIKSPTMAGGLFSMSKNYFNFLGTYDRDMLVWGGENIEMSLRIWTCGGTLEIHPCSHVGHVFRKRAPYSHPGGADVITRNNKRVAEVWMDGYKEQYYKRVPRAKSVDPGDLSGRKKLRKDLKCHNFEWFLKNVYTDLYAPPPEDIVKSGEWHNHDRENKYCLDSANPEGREGVKVTMYVCHGMGVNQEFTYTRQQELRHNYAKELCLRPDKSSVVARACEYPNSPVPREQKWILNDIGQILNVSTNKCIEASGALVSLQPCQNKLSQKWTVKKLGR